jgi:hypothetical protein
MIAVLVQFLSCAGTGGQVHRDRYLITADEIATVEHAATALDIIRYLRPNLLTRDTRRATGASGGMPALVYVNGSRLGFRNMLATITNIGIVEIKYIDGYEAGGKYGTDSAGGVFLITVK